MTLPTVTLDSASVEAIAQRVNALVLGNLIELGLEDIVDRLRASDDSSPAEGASSLVDARTVADALGCSRDTVYAHADKLGGQRIGDGPRGRLRFNLDRALEAWTSRSESGRSRQDKGAAQSRFSRRSRTPRMGSGAELLPIRGSATAIDASRDRS